MPNWYANRRFFKILIADTNRQFFKMRIVNIATSLYHFVINSLLKICIFHSKFEIFVLYIEKDCTSKKFLSVDVWRITFQFALDFISCLTWDTHFSNEDICVYSDFSWFRKYIGPQSVKWSKFEQLQRILKK